MAKTVVGLFSSMAQAEQVKQALSTEGYDAGHITVVANSIDGSSSETGVGGKISQFFSNLTGGDDDVHEHYATGVNSGGALLTATVPDDEADEVAALLKQHGARDIDGNQRAAAAGTPVYGGGSTATDNVNQTAIPIVEESLVVGKREVDRGGVRVYSHVVERPVQADVTLRDEFINVERRFVDRPATAADFAAGAGSTIELNATGEEAVVGKTSRVVEEVLVGKEATQRTDTIRDSVRKTEVEVENLAGSTTGSTTGTDYRTTDTGAKTNDRY